MSVFINQWWNGPLEIAWHPRFQMPLHLISSASTSDLEFDVCSPDLVEYRQAHTRLQLAMAIGEHFMSDPEAEICTVTLNDFDSVSRNSRTVVITEVTVPAHGWRKHVKHVSPKPPPSSALQTILDRVKRQFGSDT